MSRTARIANGLPGAGKFIYSGRLDLVPTRFGDPCGLVTPAVW